MSFVGSICTLSKLNLAASVVMLALLFNLAIQASFAHSSTLPGRDFSGVVYADVGSQVAGAIVSASGLKALVQP